MLSTFGRHARAGTGAFLCRIFCARLLDYSIDLDVSEQYRAAAAAAELPLRRRKIQEILFGSGWLGHAQWDQSLLGLPPPPRGCRVTY